MLVQAAGHRHCKGSVDCGGQTIEFTVDFGRRRNMYITVNPDCSVDVSAPKNTAMSEITQFVLSRSNWILTHFARFESLAPVLLDRPYTNGAHHLFKGGEIRLALSPRLFESVRLTGDVLEVACLQGHREDRVGELVEQWFLDRALEYLPVRLGQCFTLAAKLGISYPELRIGYMKRSWGTCSKHGWIHLNSELIKIDPACADYVIVHELCHLLERGHNKRFYGLVEQVMPGWRRHMRMLDRYVISS